MSQKFQISNSDTCIRAVIWNDYYVDWEVMTAAYDFHFSIPACDNQLFVENMACIVNNPQSGPAELIDNKTKSEVVVTFDNHYAEFLDGERNFKITTPIRYIKALLDFIKIEF